MLDTRISTAEMDAEIAMSEKTVTKSSEYRKVIKPLLEKRRRARINHCLTELKSLLLETYGSDISEPSKLEKADILELTVRHLREMRVRRSRPSTPTNPDPTRRPMVNTNTTNSGSSSFRVGFTECAGEVSAFVTSIPGISSTVRSRLLSHLSSRVERLQHHEPSQQQQHMVNTQRYFQQPASSLTPPPSPASCPSPEYSTDSGCISPAVSSSNNHNNVFEALPAGYASLAVLMSHKHNAAAASVAPLNVAHPANTDLCSRMTPESAAPVWRPW